MLTVWLPSPLRTDNRTSPFIPLGKKATIWFADDWDTESVVPFATTCVWFDESTKSRPLSVIFDPDAIVHPGPAYRLVMTP